MSQQISARISQLFASGRFAEAERLCRSATQANPRDSMPPAIRGAIRLERGDILGAMEFLKQAIALDPRNATAHFNLGVAQKKQLQLESALASFRNALKLAGPDGTILNAIGLTELALGRSAEAAATLGEAAKRNPRSSVAFLNLGEALKAAGQLDKAVTAYNKAVSLKPDFAEAFNSLGAAHAELGTPSEAEMCYRRALAVNPEHAMAHNNLGVLLKQQGRLDEALNEFEAANQTDPNYAMAYFNKGGLLNQLQKPGEALDALQKAVSLRPDLAEAHLAIGWIYYGNQSLHEAQRAFARAVDAKPDYADAHVALGGLHKLLRNMGQARACYDRALAADPGNFEAMFGLGQVFARQGTFAAADECFRRALELQPNSLPARLALAKALLDEGKLDAAESFCRAVVATAPDSGEAHLVLGNILAKQRRLEEAVLQYRQAMDIMPESVRLHVSLGEVLEKLGRKDAIEELTARLRTLIAETGANPASAIRSLSTIAELTGELDAYEAALDLAIRSERIDDLSFYPLLRSGMNLSPAIVPSLLEKLNHIEQSAKSIQKSLFHRARSLLLHELQEYGSAWQDLAVANRLVIEENEITANPQPNRRDRQLEQIRQWAGADLETGKAEFRPVFILGVSRSGKSSLESLLGKANGWTALDEYPIIEETLREMDSKRDMVEDRSTADQRGEFAARFAQRCSRYATSGTFSFTAPGQVKSVKFLAETLSGARFIFIRRNDMDTLYRCFQKLYKKGNYYSYDAKECLTHIRWYGEMIDHLSAKLGERARVVNYETLVTNASAIVPDLWQWLGLTAPAALKITTFNDIGCSEPYREMIAAELEGFLHEGNSYP